MPKQPAYKEALETALECLEESEGHAMSAVLNIAFAGEYKKLGRLYEEGELLEVDPAMFVDTGDANVDRILRLVHEIISVKESTGNLNGLND